MGALGLAVRGCGLLRGIHRGERASRPVVPGSCLGPAPVPVSQADVLYLVPAALIPLAAFVAAQYAALGEFKLAYEDFGNEPYLYEGSLWKTPLELDSLNVPWLDPAEAARRGIARESYGKYLFHMTLGHHGFWSLTPIFLFSLAGLLAAAARGRKSPGDLRRAWRFWRSPGWWVITFTIPRPGPTEVRSITSSGSSGSFPPWWPCLVS